MELKNNIEDLKNKLRQEALEKELIRLKSENRLLRKRGVFMGVAFAVIMVGSIVFIELFFNRGDVSGSNECGGLKDSVLIECVDSALVQGVVIEDCIEKDEDAICYRVQTGAYRNFDLSGYSGDVGFHCEEWGDLKFYSLGCFSSIKDAERFREALIKLGFVDCYVVSSQ